MSALHPLPVTKMCIQLNALDRSFVSIFRNKSSRLCFLNSCIFPNLNFYSSENKNYSRSFLKTHFESEPNNTENSMIGGLKI